MAGPRAFAVRLLEGQILLAVLVEEGTDRRVEIGPIEQHAADDPRARTQRDRVGGSPPSRMHGAEHVILGALKPDIDRIARQSERRARRRLEGGELRLAFEMAPEEGGEDIGQAEIHGYHCNEHSRRPTPVDFRRHPRDFGGRSVQRQFRPALRGPHA